MLTLLNFSKQYTATPILKIPEQTFSSGIHWIRGQNGSGKSTLLKVLAGLLHFEGSVCLMDQFSVKKHPISYRKLVNFAESEPAFPGFLTGMDMLRFFEHAKSAPSGQSLSLTKSFHMTDYLEHPLANYSAGMIKKLSLVLAFLGNPKLILLDEPFITLDEDTLYELGKWIEKGYEEKHISFIITSHQKLPKGIPITGTFILKNQTLSQYHHDGAQ